MYPHLFQWQIGCDIIHVLTLEHSIGSSIKLFIPRVDPSIYPSQLCSMHYLRKLNEAILGIKSECVEVLDDRIRFQTATDDLISSFTQPGQRKEIQE